MGPKARPGLSQSTLYTKTTERMPHQDGLPSETPLTSDCLVSIWGLRARPGRLAASRACGIRLRHFQVELRPSMGSFECRVSSRRLFSWRGLFANSSQAPLYERGRRTGALDLRRTQERAFRAHLLWLPPRCIPHRLGPLYSILRVSQARKETQRG